MLEIFYLVLAFTIGFGNATQLVMISAISKSRGSVEGAFTSLVSTILGVAIILSILAIRQGNISLPQPLDRLTFYVVLGALSMVVLLLVMRGLNIYFAITGLFALPFLIGAGFIGPKIGVGLYLVIVLAGQMAGAVVHDHFGTFGGVIHRFDLLRALGIFALLTGVVLVRGVR